MPTSTITQVPTLVPTPSPSPTPQPASVVASFPIDGDGAVLPERDIVLAFDQPMDEASLRAAWQISPAITGSITLSGGLHMCFASEIPWASGISYEATLRDSAHSVDGGALAEPFTVRFRTDGRGAPIPILMYHRIEELGEDASEGMRTYTVSPESFEEQLRYLRDHGWQSIGPEALESYLLRGKPLPARPVMLSMDDGYAEVYSEALPLCRQYGITPTLFIVPTYIGYGDYLDWDELEELVEAGFWVGSHGWDHANLRAADDEALHQQLRDSRQVLEEKLGITITAFSYPYGAYDERTLALLAEYDYALAVTLNPLAWQDPARPYRLNRLCVPYDMSLETFTRLFP